MRTLLRKSLIAAATVFTMQASAQYPYTWSLSGVVIGCYPGQTITLTTLGATTPAYNFTVPVDTNTCTWSAVIGLSTAYSEVQLTTPCGGLINTFIDSVWFGFLNDSIATSYTFNCGSSALDCLGIPGGPNVPGSPCNDGDPLTTGDTWNSACVCVGNALGCSASFTVSQTSPWNMATDNTSGGVAPLTYTWWMPDGSGSGAFEPTFTFTAPGVYGICLTIADGGGCSSSMCDTLIVDSAGTITNGIPVWDCLGVLGGPNMPGTPCNDGDSTTINDTWTPWCACIGTGTGPLDCLGVPGGSALPGTACLDSIGGMIVTGVWDSTCVCIANTLPDCLGVPGGTNLPGTPCNDGNPLTSNDTWNSACVCVGSTPTPCNADFWVLQAYTVDSLLGTATPIPYTLWVWNLSSGGSGAYSFTWDFGDGSSSTAPFPTHVYAGNGPYLLCLTINDGAGCIDTYCDTVQIDTAGYYVPFHGGGNDERSTGFTINVVAPGTGTGISEPVEPLVVNAFPNPVSDMLTVAFDSDRGGMVNVTVTGMDGRIVRDGRVPVSIGHNQLRMNVDDLVNGLYVVRVGDAHGSSSQRVMKVD